MLKLTKKQEKSSSPHNNLDWQRDIFNNLVELIRKDNIPVENKVRVAQDSVDELKIKTNDLKEKYTNTLLENIAPSILAFDNSFSSIQTVISDLLQIDVNPSQALENSVQYLFNLPVYAMIINDLAIPRKYKSQCMEILTKLTAQKAMEEFYKPSTGNSLVKSNQYAATYIPYKRNSSQ